MKTKDLDIRELLSVNPQGGVFSFLGQRSYLADAIALGLQRKELLATVGEELTRTIITRSGYAHGWRVAEVIKSQLPEAWSEAPQGKLGPLICSMYGFGEVIGTKRTDGTKGQALVETRFAHSFEAEQHLMQIGQTTEAICWRLTAFASGYVSNVQGKPVYFKETSCTAKGDDCCCLVGKYEEEWGEEIAPYLKYYQGHSIEEICSDLDIKIAVAQKQLKQLNQDIAQKLQCGEREECFPMAKSLLMQKVMDLALHVAATNATVLVTGESGVGKERMAHFIHQHSPRKEKPFLAINCGALTDSLLDSELFGYVRGAFTGAEKDRIGLFEAATGGTLFLDEVGELSPAMQVKLLRVLEEKEIRRIGENRARKVDVRIISATNRNLEDAVRKETFRQDLFYRLKVIEIGIPPLRERPEDILTLARCFLNQYAKELNKQINGFNYKAADLLLSYDWPGNIRELRNAIERAAILCHPPQVQPDDLPQEVRNTIYRPTASQSIKKLATIEQEYILSVLQALDNNKAQTAKKLGISLATLYRKLKEVQER